MSYRSTLPMAKNRELHKYYTEAIEHMTNLKNSITEFLSSYLDEDVESLNEHDKIEYYKLKLELHELQGRINTQENHKQIYQDRIDLMMPEFEKLSAEANAEFDNIFEQAIDIGTKYPTNRYSNTIGMILSGWNSTKNETMDSLVAQELKNETYKSLKTQIAAVKDDTKKKLSKVK